MLAALRKILGLAGERRGQPRQACDLPAQYVVLGGEAMAPLGEPRPARVVNLSPAGCCLAVASLTLDRFHLTRCLESPEDFPLEVILPGRQGQVWRGRGWVRWTNRAPAMEKAPPAGGPAADHGLPFRVGVQWCAGGLPEGWRGLWLGEES